MIPRLTYEFTPRSLTGAAIPPTGYGVLYTEMRKQAEGYVNEVVSAAEPIGVSARGEVLEDRASTVEVVIDFASNEKGDLIVTGRRGRSGFTRLLIGSVSNGLVAHAHCPVLVVR